MRWAELEPELGIARALVHAGKRLEDGSQNDKRRWSENFANGCAVAIADEFRRSDALKNKKILPASLEAGTEPLTPLGAGTSKRIDVTVVDAVLGLEIGVSLKGLNFKDVRANNFDKNLTGRLYELGDEVRLVHEHLPHAFMAAVFFLPISSTEDKSEKANSSFANAVLKLRERTGRLDPALPSHAARCDISFVALYCTGAEPLGCPAGATRCFNVETDPPRRGRPLIRTTLSLTEMVQHIVMCATYSERERWGEAEED